MRSRFGNLNAVIRLARSCLAWLYLLEVPATASAPGIVFCVQVLVDVVVLVMLGLLSAGAAVIWSSSHVDCSDPAIRI